VIDKNLLQSMAADVITAGILSVGPKTVHLKDMSIPVDGLLMFHLALTSALNGDEVTQAHPRAYNTRRVALPGAREGWYIASNEDPEQRILLTRKLMTELVEILAYFLGESPLTFDLTTVYAEQ
jgi:hypothetical protein